MNAELFARAPDHIRLLLTLLEDEPVGTDDFYCRWALQSGRVCGFLALQPLLPPCRARKHGISKRCPSSAR